MRPTAAAATAASALVAALALAGGCESRREAERRAEQAIAEAERGPRVGEGPQAAMIRFQETRGGAFSREAWEVEVLHVGGQARLRGSFRAPDAVVPVGGTLSPAEWVDFWTVVSAMPLDRLRVVEDTTTESPGWTKRLDVDIVVGPERRIVSRNTWTRPPVGAPWLDELEGTLRALAAAHALGADPGAGGTDSTREAVGRAVREAMRDLGATAREDAADAP